MARGAAYDTAGSAVTPAPAPLAERSLGWALGRTRLQLAALCAAAGALGLLHLVTGAPRRGLALAGAQAIGFALVGAGARGAGWAIVGAGVAADVAGGLRRLRRTRPWLMRQERRAAARRAPARPS